MLQNYEKVVNKNQDIDSQQQRNVKFKDKSGVQTILSNSCFSNRLSSLYLKEVKSYFDMPHQPQISEMLNEVDPNFIYSVNSSSLWLLMKQKLKNLSAVGLFENSSDRIIINFSIQFGCLMSLNNAKQKVVELERTQLRKNLKDHIQKKIKRQQSRRVSIDEQFNKSSYFRDASQKLNLKYEDMSALKNDLLQFKFKKSKLTIGYLQKILSLLQTYARQKESQFRKKRVQSQLLVLENVTRQAYCVMLISNYLNIYLIYQDLINLMLKDKSNSISKLLFRYITDRKGFHILNRILDDAPIKTLGEEIIALQKAFYSS